MGNNGKGVDFFIGGDVYFFEFCVGIIGVGVVVVKKFGIVIGIFIGC